MATRFALLAMLLLLSMGLGCATVPERGCVAVAEDSAKDSADEDFDEFDDFDISEAPPPRDPLHVYNRFMFTCNDKAYTWVLRPVARVYRWVLPEPVRASVQKCANNLGFPVRFINSGLQGNFKGAGVELARFGINSTVGILGLFDPAASACDLQPADEDFGQTLGRYGVGPGWPLVLPLLGPTNIRDAFGMAPDYFLHPFSYIEPAETSLAVQGIEKENYLSLHMDEYEAIKEDAFDLYTFMRDAYRQKREAEIEE
ncbi:MAG: VacJ family lipoprotein [Verrucomicrobia bacterium]|nr:VacJ family lipoprotein [Verrucomicrobiota bacterium]MBT7067859.1 VacJ family lipoprotein [Verrucomicrobiota bacterium]MBT7699862.1 VacJ family lipoprotein [Verrucomicrobiota bacterium]